MPGREFGGVELEAQWDWMVASQRGETPKWVTCCEQARRRKESW